MISDIGLGGGCHLVKPQSLTNAFHDLAALWQKKLTKRFPIFLHEHTHYFSTTFIIVMTDFFVSFVRLTSEMPFVAASYLTPASYVSPNAGWAMSSPSSTLDFARSSTDTANIPLCQLDPREYFYQILACFSFVFDSMRFL